MTGLRMHTICGVPEDLFLLYFFIWTCTANATTQQTSKETLMSDEKRLIRDLLSTYERVGRHGRPVLNISAAVSVRFGLGLIQMDLDDRHNKLTMSTWTRYKWRDSYLMWDPAAYGNVTKIMLDPNLIWVPDIMLQNKALAAGSTKDTDLDIANRHAMCVISHRGVVGWYPHTVISSSCSVDITNFPFDAQNCSLNFFSWTYSSRELDLDFAFSGGIDLSTFQSEFKESCAWHITEVVSERQLPSSSKTHLSFTVLYYGFTFSRKMVFSSYILILPCVFLAFLTMVVFWLPPGRPDRTSLAMSIFSSFMVLLLILVEAAPPTASSIPTLGVYYCFNLVLIMVSIILSSLVVNISRLSRKVPRWLYMIIGEGIATIVLLRKRDLKSPEFNLIENDESKFKSGQDCHQERHQEHHQEGEQAPKFEIEADADISNASCVSSRLLDMRIAINDIQTTVRQIQDKVSLAEQDKLFQIQQWKHIALVLDRFFATVYLVLIIISLTTMFPKPL